MSNLRGYQKMTTLAKKVGGPAKYNCLLMGVGVVLGVVVNVAGENIKKELEKKKQATEAAIVHTVNEEGSSNEGLLFKVGDKFKVLEVDGDAALIEKLGDDNNPYFVSANFLNSISDYNFS